MEREKETIYFDERETDTDINFDEWGIDQNIIPFENEHSSDEKIGFDEYSLIPLEVK